MSHFVRMCEVPEPEREFRGGPKIYALLDPRFDDVRYVGVTSQSLESRLDMHLKNPTNRRTRSWFDELCAMGTSPDIVGLQSVGRGADWRIAEMQWIAWFRARGDLLNVDDGGELVEDGNGLDDIKREKAAAFLASACAQLGSNRPPACAQEQRGETRRRADRRKSSRRAPKPPGPDSCVVTPETWRQLRRSNREMARSQHRG